MTDHGTGKEPALKLPVRHNESSSFVSEAFNVFSQNLRAQLNEQILEVFVGFFLYFFIVFSLGKLVI